MRRTRIRMERRSPWGLGVLAVLLVLAIAPPVSAEKPIVVSAADPDMGEQGTLDLEVTVSGDNFPSDAWADFFVTGTTDPGGITVKNVKRQGPKSLKVTIDIDEAAQTELRFDIQVRSRGNGRSGKGTELFGVTQKQPGNQDLTPPGAPLDLHLVEAGFSIVTIAWTMPADDGYEVTSGPVKNCKYYEPAESAWNNFNHCLGNPGVNLNPWPAPGEEQVCIMNWLEPETEYLYRVMCADESGNWSDEAQVLTTTRPFSELQDPTWSIEEVPIPVDGLVGHGFDGDGNVVIGGVVALWGEMGSGKWATVPTAIRVITGALDEGTGGWSWSYEDVPGFASRLQMSPNGFPAFEGGVLVNAKKRIRDLVYTFNDGVGWRSEVVATGLELGLRFPRGFAFDPDGNPAIAWCSRDGGVRLARRVSNGQWDVDVVGSDVCVEAGRSAGLTFDDSGNAAITYNTETSDGDLQMRMALWSGGTWIFETICGDPGCPPEAVGMLASSVVFDPQWGDFSIAGDDWLRWMLGCDRSGPGQWQCTQPVFGQLGQQGMFGNLIAQGVRVGENVLEVDSSGALSEQFASYAAENGYGIGLARRFRGTTEWLLEFVDHPSLHGLAYFDDGGGPFVAVDPSGLPTLTWQWNVGGEPPSEYHLYFAWKTAP